MPIAMENALKKVAAKMARKGELTGPGDRKEKMARFVYGIMRKRGWKPARERK
jgi:hypothetical protein